MNAPIDHAFVRSQRLADLISSALARVAPSWPLDRFIAVNPYWGWVAEPMPQAAAALGTLAGTRLTMPRAWFRQRWQSGRLQVGHLRAALAQQAEAHVAHDTSGTSSLPVRLDQLIAALDTDCAPLPRLPLVTDLRERLGRPRPGLCWGDLVTHQISQHCAAFFDRHQATWPMDASLGLYESWRRQLDADHGLPWRQGRATLCKRLADLPAAPQEVIAAALAALDIPEHAQTDYLSAVLMAIGGWAAWCAYQRWQARLAGNDDDQVEQLLAIRLAWEWLLAQDAPPGSIPVGWAAQWGQATVAMTALQQAQRVDWLLQGAVEIAFQQSLISELQKPKSAPAPMAPAVQAIFCIDVRSEVFRRALEHVSARIHTRGFAGFFGLSIAYSPVGSNLQRAQLPGLLAPTQCVSEQCAAGTARQALATRRGNALQWRQRWAQFRAAPSSAFSFVESMGLLYGAKLLADSLPSTKKPARWEDTGLAPQAVVKLRPCLPQAGTDPADAAATAAGILRAMGLVDGFAPLVMLTGHGSQSANNPHAAGLDCGACGGQTGEVNARVLADLLNASAVRDELRKLGIDIPSGTHFLPALHNTTTDQVELYDTDAVPADLHAQLAQLRDWLTAAGNRARTERAASLGLAALAEQGAELKQAVLARANDWAQLRPEWGLADNAAFIVAPRARSQGLNLAGRSFLHDYDYRTDVDLRVLTLIMTAPMVVTHWINMQYHASTVDNRRYGSGNKVLHNVVGGHIGVFEGNGGDLRIGLPLQSLHDGRSLRHTPLRLSVFIEAPRAAIDSVMASHQIVRQLVGNGWLHLFRIDPQTNAVEQQLHGVWHAAQGD